MPFDLDQINFAALGKQLLESFYALGPYLIASILIFLLLSLIARKLPTYRKNLVQSVAKAIAGAVLAVGIARGLIPWGMSADYVFRIKKAIFVFLPFYVGAATVRFVMGKLSQKVVVYKKTLVQLISRAFWVFMIAMGAVSSLNVLGFNLTVLIGSLGISGLALGLAVKTSVSNIVSGILIILYEPFKIGDRIVGLGKEGVVEKIELKYVTIRQDEKIIHHLPNEKLLNDSITVKS